MRASHDSREIFAQVSCDSRETFARASHDSRETSARVSYDVRVSFIISQVSLEMVLFMLQSIAFVSHICHMAQNAETKLQCVCEGLATGSRHMR